MWERLLQWLFPDTCIGCGVSGTVLCKACLAAAAPYTAPTPWLGADQVWVLFAYEGVVRSALLALKYARKPRLAGVFGVVMAAAVPCGYAGVVALPAARSRVATRGYDQAVLLAQALARTIGVPCLAGLVRTKDTVAQAKLGRAARQRNVAGVFAWCGPAPAGRVLLVDDICTTGATLRAAITALRSAGCTAIDVVVVARGEKAPFVPENERC